ncbi:MAG: type II toxin-antitoxin system VapC family toxin [Myxococcaceae bacterium]
MIVVDTSGLIALLDADDAHHDGVREAFDAAGDAWVLPWAILPEVDYLATKYLGPKVALAFLRDVVRGVFRVTGYDADDMKRSVGLQQKYASLELGLVDSVVMAQAMRFKAKAIVTLDRRHFRAVSFGGSPPPRLIPLDSP